MSLPGRMFLDKHTPLGYRLAADQKARLVLTLSNLDPEVMGQSIPTHSVMHLYLLHTLSTTSL